MTGVVFFILLITTGLLLNHTGALGLGKRFVETPWVLDLYHISAPEPPVAFSAGEHFVSRIGDRLYVDTKEVPERADRLIGGLKLGDTLLIAIPGKLLVISPTGELIERIESADGVPAGMNRIGLTASGQLVIRAAHGDYLADLEKLDWRKTTTADVVWAMQVTLPPELEEKLTRAYRGGGLPLERVILDLHSGRIVGQWGVYVVDGAALLFLALVITGLWMWARHG
ncbi:MAG: PepSY domain-containing protein [Gammaproteobacteria bacterium]